jgi:Copper type II ascorbate-dependent monooxygenase, C-terminal domain
MRPMFASLAALALAAGACTDDRTDPAPDPDPEPGLTLRMAATIPPGAEVEYCQFVIAPETWVTKDLLEFTAGSHHVLVYQTSYAAIPTQRDDGAPVDTSGVFDCSDGVIGRWSVTKLVGGSQNRSGESFLSFPEGVGTRVGGVLLMNVHYRNASDAPLSTDVKVTFETTTADQIVQEGDVMLLYNPLISVPPGGTARAHWRCPVHRDITIANVQSHMHARGIGFAARVDTEPPFYVNDRWEGVPVRRYEHLAAKAGSVLDYYCDYRNTSGAPIYQGPRTTDEMCVLFASYYPADPRTASCSDELGRPAGGEWIGQGTATCQQTMDCLGQSPPGSIPAMTDCMLAASPSVSRESSELFRCMVFAKDPSTECGPQIQACAAR